MRNNKTNNLMNLITIKILICIKYHFQNLLDKAEIQKVLIKMNYKDQQNQIKPNKTHKT